MALHRRWKCIAPLYTAAFLSKQQCVPNPAVLSYLLWGRNYCQKRIQPALLASVQLGSVPAAPLIFLSPPSCARRKGGPRSGEAASAFKADEQTGRSVWSLARVYLTCKQEQWPPDLLLCLWLRCQMSYLSRSLPSSFCFGMWKSKIDRCFLW